MFNLLKHCILADIGTAVFLNMVTANFSDLFSVLFYCFLIILFGYAAGRFNFITSTQSQGIGSFIGKFLCSIFYRLLAFRIMTVFLPACKP